MGLKAKNTLEHIVASICAAGYDPYAQLYGYLKTGEDTYITRTGDARALVKTLSRSELQSFVEHMQKTNNHEKRAFQDGQRVT